MLLYIRSFYYKKNPELLCTQKNRNFLASFQHPNLDVKRTFKLKHEIHHQKTCLDKDYQVSTTKMQKYSCTIVNFIMYQRTEKLTFLTVHTNINASVPLNFKLSKSGIKKIRSALL